MKGEIDKIWENETKDNKAYHVLDIGGDRYSVWDPNLIEGLNEGSYIEFEWQKSGNFKKITELKKIDMNPNLETGYKPNNKSREIVRMSCIRSASEILQGCYIEPHAKVNIAMDIAKEFEKYITGVEEENPGIQGKEKS